MRCPERALRRRKCPTRYLARLWRQIRPLQGHGYNISELACNAVRRASILPTVYLHTSRPIRMG